MEKDLWTCLYRSKKQSIRQIIGCIKTSTSLLTKKTISKKDLIENPFGEIDWADCAIPDTVVEVYGSNGRSVPVALEI